MSRYKVGVKIMPREVILDTQGRAVEQILKQNQFHPQQLRVGRFVELVIEGSEAEALKEAKKMTEFVLYNPLLENFELVSMGEVR